jgi:hypothetical protein
MSMLLISVAASIVAFTHFDNVAAYIVIAPGYLVQSWLFEHHRAPGGFGYTLTMVGASALFWTLIILGLGSAARSVANVARRKRTV